MHYFFILESLTTLEMRDLRNLIQHFGFTMAILKRAHFVSLGSKITITNFVLKNIILAKYLIIL